MAINFNVVDYFRDEMKFKNQGMVIFYALFFNYNLCLDTFISGTNVQAANLSTTVICTSIRYKQGSCEITKTETKGSVCLYGSLYVCMGLRPSLLSVVDVIL